MVVFNADDFGYTSNINRAVEAANGRGLLKSASLMATGQAFDEAAGLAPGLEDFSVGVHLCATQTRSCLPRRLVADLVDESGYFRHAVGELGWRLFCSGRLVEQISGEWRAQIERIMAAGLRPDHLNGHQHIHMHPVLFGRALRLAEEYKIPMVRLPHTNLRLTSRLDPHGLPRKVAKSAVFTALRWSCLTAGGVNRYRVLLTDHTYGLLQIGRMNESYLSKLLEMLPEGLSEIYVHPGLRPEPCSPGIRRDVELAALLSDRVRERVAQLELTVTHFRGWMDQLEQSMKSKVRIDAHSDRAKV